MTQALIVDDADPFFIQLLKYEHGGVEDFLRIKCADRPHARLLGYLPSVSTRAFSLKTCWRERYGAISQTLMEPDGARSQIHQPGTTLLGLFIGKEDVSCITFTLRSEYSGRIGQLAGRIVRSSNRNGKGELSHVIAIPPYGEFDAVSTAMIEVELVEWVAAMDTLCRRWTGKEIYSALT